MQSIKYLLEQGMGQGKSLGAKTGQKNGSLQRSEQQAPPMESQHYVVTLFYHVKLKAFCN